MCDIATAKDVIHHTAPQHPLTKSTSIKHRTLQKSPSSKHHFSFRRFFGNIDDKIKSFWKGLPDQIGYEFVTEIIENKFKDIEEHFKLLESHSPRHRRDVSQVKTIFNELDKTNTVLQNEVEKMKKINPELLVKTSKDDHAQNETEQLLESAITSLEPKTASVPANKNLITMGTLN
uniref:Uncharacterized protein n=1 Tax=Ditylenchus dipsaci TaxID=166011 RepID=A0A915D400_9BILA